ncbi:hypothetical protein [Stutzerimonas balearica]|uniref:hypothetical protein n=1 Tax=Stutzerimonas balearica TaxID=74829 RepID=UPI0028A1100C|nr:hypothetical protein [Stutzerimonas balearica]
MRSDWDDVPEYLRNRKKPSPWRFLAFLGLGSAVISALALTFGKQLTLDINQIKQGIHVAGKPWFNQAPTQPTQPASQPSVAIYEAPTAEPSFEPHQRQLSKEEIEWFNKAKADALERRQTSFNDDNYTPKQPASTYSPPAIQRIATPSSQRPRTVRRERTVTRIKSWNGGTTYLAQWISVNNYIDGTTVCANHRRGSIDYRECRKAAKQYFHEQCRAWRARFDSDRKDHSDRMKTRYCGAASSFNPMG